ncbi:MAG: hypothetical protein H6621_00900 [Halobacteriovoraceae bacterium]|nr:hypothetical protein [Halobacteriovoraceae bacterium]MCB9093599.1 hypothetical protein [Halobacteriovoraceae bacterium]
MRWIILGLLLSATSLGYAEFSEEMSLKSEIYQTKSAIDTFIKDKFRLVDFNLRQKISFFRIRLGKHPSSINRPSELSWVEHDIFLIDQILDGLYEFRHKRQITDFEEVIVSFEDLKKTYKGVLNFYKEHYQ